MLVHNHPVILAIFSDLVGRFVLHYITFTLDEYTIMGISVRITVKHFLLVVDIAVNHVYFIDLKTERTVNAVL